MPDFQALKQRIAKLTADEAISALTVYLADHPRDTEALTLRGMRHFGAGHRALAINDYLAALEIDPECKAKQALQATNDILDFYNKDLFNP